MKYQLEPYSTPPSRYHCPSCKKRRRTFVRYINTETGDHLAHHVARCGRENNCGYHFKPAQYFQEQGTGWMDRKQWSVANTRKGVFKPKNKLKTNAAPSQGSGAASPVAAQPLYIAPAIVDATICKYDRNNFVQYLLGTFGTDVTYRLICLYRVGTAKHWHGATVFWQIDAEGWVRTGKVMLYNAQTGKRVKEPFNHITWVHSLLSPKSQVEGLKSTTDLGLQTQDFKLRQCLFGEHLLAQFPGKPVAIVESEKTAIIATAYNDSFIWLACGSISNLSIGLCKVLNGRRVTLYPDLGAYDKWTVKVRQLAAAMPKSRFAVSRILEDQANDNDRKAGLDLGDFLSRIKTN